MGKITFSKSESTAWGERASLIKENLNGILRKYKLEVGDASRFTSYISLSIQCSKRSFWKQVFSRTLNTPNIKFYIPVSPETNENSAIEIRTTPQDLGLAKRIAEDLSYAFTLDINIIF